MVKTMKTKLNWEGPCIPKDNRDILACSYQAETPIGLLRIHFMNVPRPSYTITKIATTIRADKFYNEQINLGDKKDCTIEEAKEIAEEWLYKKYQELHKIFEQS